MKSIPCVVLCVVCAGVGVMSLANPIAINPYGGATTTATSLSGYSQSISTSGARWVTDTAAPASRGIGISAATMSESKDRSADSSKPEKAEKPPTDPRLIVRQPTLLEIADENVTAVKEHEAALEKLYGEIREVDQKLIAQYEASDAKGKMLFLCVLVVKRFLGFKTGRALIVKQYACGDESDEDAKWLIPRRISDPDVFVPAWLDRAQMRCHVAGDNISIGSRKVIVLHALETK